MNRRDVIRRASCAFALRAAERPLEAMEAGHEASDAFTSVRSFGATGDGKTVDSAAVNRALEHLAAQGGGTLVFPSGTYVCFTIRLKSHVDLYLSRGCTILAADSPRKSEQTGYRSGTYDPAEPNEPWTPYQDYGHSHWHNSLFVADGQCNFGIYGPGLIHGKGLSNGHARAHYAAWLQYGDLSVVRTSWPAMQRWMAFILENNPDFLRRKGLGNNFGDWLAPDDRTPKDLIGTAYWALDALYMAQMAKALDHNEDAALYQQQYKNIAAAFRTAYIKADGTVAGETQASYLAAVFTGIAPPDAAVNMVQRLKDDLHKHGNHLTTGFLGTPFLLPVLDQSGNAALAFELLLSETYPSWGYMVKNGATTWWERWNGDSGDPAMNSYNHYAFGSVMAWVYRRAAGIDTDGTDPGFHHILVQPHFTPRLPQLHVEYDSAYGLIISDWKQSSHRFSITIPANTTATLSLPGRTPTTVGSGTHAYTVTE